MAIFTGGSTLIACMYQEAYLRYQINISQMLRRQKSARSRARKETDKILAFVLAHACLILSPRPSKSLFGNTSASPPLTLTHLLHLLVLRLDLICHATFPPLRQVLRNTLRLELKHVFAANISSRRHLLDGIDCPQCDPVL